MADNDRVNKPKETISYYDGGFTSSDSSIGFGLGVSGGAGIFVPIGDNTPQRSVSRVTGTVVEETSEYVIVMTSKNELVKIRPENIIERRHFSEEEEKKRVNIVLEGGLGLFILMLGALIFIFGSVWLWAVFVVVGGLLSLHAWSQAAKK